MLTEHLERESERMNQLFEFIDAGVSPFHAVKEAAKRLDRAGFMSLSEMEPWELEPDKCYYVTRNESSIIAFRLPKSKPVYYHLTASHSDSPTYRIKKNKMDDKYYARAEVEGYGGMIHSSWLDRPLGLAGRIVVRTADGVRTQLFAPDRDVFVIPNLSVHMNREINNGYKYNPQVDLQPLYGGEESDLEKFIAEEAFGEKGAGKDADAKVLDMDLVLTVRQKATKVGAKEEYFMAPRIDDLACAYTTLMGFLSACQAAEGNTDEADTDKINLWCMFDNEEVGSSTRQGAMGAFLPEVLSRLEGFYSMTAEESVMARSRSLLISADNAHATHPNLPAKTDSEFPVVLNQGIVVKYNASQRYTTTGMTAAVFKELCEKEEIPVQRFANRADAPGGSTLGNLLSHQFSVPMLDIGLPQLAMHSAVETAGCEDVKFMERAIEAFYRSGICQVRDGEWMV